MAAYLPDHTCYCPCPNCGWSNYTTTNYYITPIYSDNNFGPLPLVIKNWRWFHVFTDWLINRVESVRDQIKKPLSLHRYRAKVSVVQRRHHKRRMWLQAISQ